MRRIAAVFASKRSDRSDAASSTAAASSTDHSSPAQKQSTAKPHTRFFRSISRKSKPVDPVVNRLNSSELHPPSSSSSSSGAPTTPDDDRGSLLRAPVSKAWLPLPPSLDHRSTTSLHHAELLTPHDRSSFHSTPRPRAAPSRQSTLDTEDDSSEESSAAPDLSRPPERATPLAAPAYLLALTSNHLRPPFAPPPLLHVPGCPIFPRSCNPRRALPCTHSLESSMHRTRLQRRLQRGDLTPSESRSIASFAGRRSAPRQPLSLQLDDNAVDHRHIKPFSPGLRKWADRPCFEDRVQVLLAENAPADNGEPAWTRVVPATDCGVAALEYSVALELLAGLYEEEPLRLEEPRASEPGPIPLDILRLDTQLSLDLSPSLSQSSMTQSPSTPSEPQSSTSSLSAMAPASAPATTSSLAAPSNSSSASRNHHYKANPSPLRMEATSSQPSLAQTIASPAPSATSTAVASPRSLPSIASPPTSAPPVPLKSALKQGVRFAEGEKEDKDDGVPLGYVQRIKQKREEKVRFLQAERERRRYEEERRKHEEEKRRWEEERAAWEREKRAIEEERKKRMYADEIAAARSRRESQRFGPLGAMTGEGLATGQWDRNERARPEREGSSTHTRPMYDSAAHPHGPPRQGSDVSLHQGRSPRTPGSVSGSPSESRPGSIYGAANVPGPSRPSSMYSGPPTPSSSQQDVRLRERRVSGTGSRRTSMVSEAGGSHKPMPVPPLPMAPMWGMPMNMNVPTMPNMPMGMAVPMPMYGGMDMPLLPPSPPFMMQQYGYRAPSQGSNRNSQHSPQRSHSSSPTLGRQQLPASGSSERVNRLSQSHTSSTSARSPSIPRSESTPRRGHHRTSSGEVPPRPSNLRAHSDDKRSTKSAAATPQRPTPTHSSSLPPHPPPSFNQARQSWALPKSGFENISRQSQGSRRQTIIS
ncbi:hypothetical protein C8Q77DRAFT_1070480 [Trametes polyzona]|nr:hypothetical protein C8Q77DRAFT_1070480 [Trametes polyzona]